jgi:hypothetical protein
MCLAREGHGDALTTGSGGGMGPKTGMGMPSYKDSMAAASPGDAGHRDAGHKNALATGDRG